MYFNNHRVAAVLGWIFGAPVTEIVNSSKPELGVVMFPISKNLSAMPKFGVDSEPLAYLTSAYFKSLYGVKAPNAGDQDRRGLNWDKLLEGVTDAWNIGGTQGVGSIVAVIDTGIDITHPDLQPNILSGYNFTSELRLDYQDRAGHGSHCSGIIAACLNDIGVTGVAPLAKILSLKVLGDDGSGNGDWVASGIRYAVDQGVDVISMSLGCQAPYDPIKIEIKRALDMGVIVCCAAGNDGQGSNVDSIDWPARYNSDPDINGAITVVAAVDQYSARAYFSSEGPELTISAPGVDIYSTFPVGAYAVLSGTSMATPAISGFAALVKSKYKQQGKTINGLQFNQLLASSAKDLGVSGKDIDYGFGLIVGGALFQQLAPISTTAPGIKSLSLGRKMGRVALI